MGLGPVVTIASSLTSFGFKTLTRPKHLLYDMFVCRTDSVVFMLICRAQAYFWVFRTSRPRRQKIPPMQECAARYGRSSAANCSRFHDVSTKISCFIGMSSSSGMKRVGVALFAPELRCKLENAPGID